MEYNDKTGLPTPAFSPEQTALSAAMTEIMRPMMQAIGKMLEKNVEAMERLAATQTIQNDRLEALEKQIRLQTPISSKQTQYLNEAIRNKARKLLDKRGLADNKKAVAKLGNAIRKDVLARYGVAGLREIPHHEYQVAMNQIDIWSNAPKLRDIVREARENEITSSGPSGHLPFEGKAFGQSAGVDGAQAVSGADHQLHNTNNVQIKETGCGDIEL